MSDKTIVHNSHTKGQKRTIRIKGKNFSTLTKNYIASKKKLEHYRAINEDAKNKLLTKGIDFFVDLYEKEGQNPGSFFLEDDEQRRINIISKDQYEKLDEKEFFELMSKYSRSILLSEVIYEFDQDLFKKYKTHILNLISTSKVISDVDKKKLIKHKKQFTIKKGTIDNLKNIKSNSLKETIGDIGVIFNVS